LDEVDSFPAPGRRSINGNVSEVTYPSENPDQLVVDHDRNRLAPLGKGEERAEPLLG
jgi:hypothetical protein